MLQSVDPGTFYRNIKTQKIYKVIAIAKHSETEESLVIYCESELPRFSEVGELNLGRCLETQVWARPIELFKEKFEVYS